MFWLPSCSLSLILGPIAVTSPLHSPFHRFMRFCFVTHSVSPGPSVTRNICWWLPTLFNETGSLAELRAHWWKDRLFSKLQAYPCLYLPSTCFLGTHCCIQLLQGCWYLTPHQHIYMARTLVTELIFHFFFGLKKNIMTYDIGSFSYLIHDNLKVSRLSKQPQSQMPCN